MSSSIQWTDETWNPTTGCTRVSEGCRHCYIERTPPFRMNGRKLGDPVQLHPDRLEQPLRWTKPRRVFVNSLSDLFHDDVPVDFLKLVLRVIAAAPHHTFQVLTKRPERMRRFMSGTNNCDFLGDSWGRRVRRDYALAPEVLSAPVTTLRLANLWLGVSVEDQKTADERIPILLQTPAAVRFVSYEPALWPVDLRPYLPPMMGPGWVSKWRPVNYDGKPLIHWVIAGGESGPGARPCDVAHLRSIVQQCTAAGVPVFVKQLGRNCQEIAYPTLVSKSECRRWQASGWTRIEQEGQSHWRRYYRFEDKKGGDPAEWPADLRVREWPR